MATVITKTFALAKDVTANLQYVRTEKDAAQPETPTGYTRLAEADIDLGDAGFLWAYVKLT